MQNVTDDEDYDEAYHEGFTAAKNSFYYTVRTHAYKFGVDTSDYNEVFDFMDKLGLDPYYGT